MTLSTLTCNRIREYPRSAENYHFDNDQKPLHQTSQINGNPMAEPSPKEEPPPTNFLCKLVSKVPFQTPTCSSVVDTILREKLGILSPKEIYIPGPEHDNCTLQTDKYYTQGKPKSKEKDRKKPEKDGHGARASHSHIPTNQGHTHIHEESHSHGENLENPIGSPLGRSDEHGCLKNPHAHCCKSGPPSHHSGSSSEEIHSSHVNHRGCLNKNCVSTSSAHNSSTGGASNDLNIDFCPPRDEVHSECCLPKKSASHEYHGEGPSTESSKKCTGDHDCCASGSHSHDLHDENPWKSSEGDCSTLHPSLNLGPSRSSLKECDSTSSSKESSKKIQHECYHTGSNLHGSVGGNSTRSYQTNGLIHDHTHDHTHGHKHCAPHSHSYKSPKPSRAPPSKVEYLFGALVHSHHSHDHKCCAPHTHSHRSHEPPRAPLSKGEYLLGTLVPPPPTHSSPSTPVPEYLIYKPEPPKKAFVSSGCIGPIKWNRPGKNFTNQAPTKQAGSGKVSAPEAHRSQTGLPRREVEIKIIIKDANTNQIHVSQEISRQESTETSEFENGLPRPEIYEDIVTRPSGTTPRHSCDLSHAALERPVNKAFTRVENPEQGNTGRIEAKECKQEDVLNVHRSKVSSDSLKTQQSDARLPRPTHILPPTLNSSPGFSGFLWHDESGFLDKKALEEQFKKSQVLMQLVPDGYVQSPDIPSKSGNSAEREETPLEPSVGALETKDSNSTWESFEFLLSDYRVVCLVDDSLSMAGRPWLLASEIVPQIALLCAKYSGAEGAEIRFVNNISGRTDQVGLDPRDVRTTEKAQNLFPRTPEGKKNPMGLELNKILSPYVRRWKQHGLNAEKPVDVIILTASSPSDYTFCIKSVVDITKELDKLGAPPAQICIQFFQISKAPAVTNDLKKLSEELIRKCTGRKIVNTFLWNEQVEAEAWSAHVVLDCVRKMVDQKIFAAPTKSIAWNKVPGCKCCT